MTEEAKQRLMEMRKYKIIIPHKKVVTRRYNHRTKDGTLTSTTDNGRAK